MQAIVERSGYRALRLAPAAAYVSAPISHFISSEMIDLTETP
jgi:hypothetical protein